MSPTALTAKSLVTGIRGHPSTNPHAHPHANVNVNGIGHGNIMDDFDGRTRNAKAQKRHREKQKARVKALEENVQVLTVQLEDARRQLGQLPYPPGSSRGPIGPHSPEFVQLQGEVNYLRDENADLRRQLYSLRMAYGGGSEPVGHPQAPGQPASGPHSPPVRHGNGQGQGRSNNDTSMQSTPNPEGSSVTSSNGTFQPGVDQYSSTPRSAARHRVLSASSAPSASPYVSSGSFPADLRAHSLSNSANQSSSDANAANSGNNTNSNPTQIESRYPLRYESHMYPPTAPPPHALPRSQMYGVDAMQYGRGQEEGMPWGPESGPPPFAGAMSGYAGVGFPHEGPGSGHNSGHVSEPWRSEH